MKSADMGAYPAADMSEFSGLADQADEALFVDVDVADIARMMDARESFVLLCAYADCPWCEALIGPLAQAARDAGWTVALLDTRKDPSWQSNLDIDGYDEFVARFGDWLEADDNGTPHLYVPDLYFVRNGQVVARHDGVLEGYDDPDVPMTDDQRTELLQKLSDEFATLH